MALITSEADLQQNLMVWNEILFRSEMNINNHNSKSKAMAISECLNKNIDGVKLGNVDTIKYIWVTIDRSDPGGAILEQRITKTLKIYPVVCKKMLNRQEILNGNCTLEKDKH